MIRLSGRMTPRVIASRSSATFLPEKSIRDCAAWDAADAVPAAVSPALRAPFCAFCWRARALPPAFAARLRAAALVPDDDEDDARRLLLLLALPLDFVPLARAVDFLAPEARLPPPLDFEALPPRVLLERPEPELELREVDPPALRELDPPDDLREVDDLLPEPPLEDDDLPLLPLLDCAMLSSSEALPATGRAGRTISCPRRT
jgi:hypothetical protein